MPGRTDLCLLQVIIPSANEIPDMDTGSIQCLLMLCSKASIREVGMTLAFSETNVGKIQARLDNLDM